MSKLGLIAGGGALPLSVAARCEAEGRPVFVVRLAGFADPHLARYPGVDAGMAEIGRVLSALKKSGLRLRKSGRLTTPAKQTASQPAFFRADSTRPISAMPASTPG